MHSSQMMKASNKAKNSTTTTTNAHVMNRRSTISDNRYNDVSSRNFNKALDSTMQQGINTIVIEDDSSSLKSQAEEINMIQLDVKIPQLEEMTIKTETSMQAQPTISKSGENPTPVTNLSNIYTSQTRRPSLISNRPSSGLNYNRASHTNMRNRTITRQSSSTPTDLNNPQKSQQQPPSIPNSSISQPSQDKSNSSNISSARDNVQQFSRDTSYRLSSILHNTSNPLRDSILLKRQDSNHVKSTNDNGNGSNSRSSIKK